MVPADKAASNIIVVCKKHYLDMILSELTLNGSNTYIDSNLDCNTLISRHIHDMKQWNISIPLIMQGYHPSIGYPKCIKTHMVLGLLQLLVNVQRSPYLSC